MFVAGTMTNWKAIEMGRPTGENDFITIVNCPEGDAYYKFYVDGAWKHDIKQQCVRKKGSSDGRAWNVIKVQKSDVDVFEALACDSFQLKTNRYRGRGPWNTCRAVAVDSLYLVCQVGPPQRRGPPGGGHVDAGAAVGHPVHGHDVRAPREQGPAHPPAASAPRAR